MSKRVKIESLHLVISSFGTVCGVGIDPASACRDAAEGSGIYSNWKNMALSGSYAVTNASANASYEPAELAEDFSAWERAREERYSNKSDSEQ